MSYTWLGMEFSWDRDFKQQKLKDFSSTYQILVHSSNKSGFYLTNNIGTPNLQGIAEFLPSKSWEVPTKVPFTNQILGPKHLHNISYIIYNYINYLYIYIIYIIVFMYVYGNQNPGTLLFTSDFSCIHG